MSIKRANKKRKPIRFKSISIKLTTRQKRSLERFAQSRRTTPNKIIKKAIRPLLENYADLEVNMTNEKINQLQLFESEQVNK
ncbi:MAG: hypothetical protein H8D88_01635 [Bacteroidetes bacterium]|nr:hypothetical protein [Bacteroidota bacterium]